MRRCVLSKADQDRIHELAQPRAGKKPRSRQEIANRIGKPASVVGWYMYRHGLAFPSVSKVAAPFRRKGGVVVRRYRPDEDVFIAALRADGHSFSKIAAMFTEAFGYERSKNSVQVRLIILAGFEAAAEDRSAAA